MLWFSKILLKSPLTSFSLVFASAILCLCYLDFPFLWSSYILTFSKPRQPSVCHLINLSLYCRRLIYFKGDSGLIQQNCLFVHYLLLKASRLNSLTFSTSSLLSLCAFLPSVLIFCLPWAWICLGCEPTGVKALYWMAAPCVSRASGKKFVESVCFSLIVPKILLPQMGHPM